MKLVTIQWSKNRFKIQKSF